VSRRVALAEADGTDLVLVAPSAALGLHDLPPDDAAELAAAWHVGAAGLPAPFRAWATAPLREPDPAALDAVLADGFVGLELPATALVTPAAIERVAPLLEVVQARGAAVLVHPGPVALREPVPSWWAPVVGYVQQLHASWWAWAEAGRSLFAALPVCFCALAGLAPLHGERHRARGGVARPVDPLTFLETSSYGPQALDSTLRVLGVDVVCDGSDRPYAPPTRFELGDAVDHALRVANPRRLLSTTSLEVSL
jgi:hypothetical protein